LITTEAVLASRILIVDDLNSNLRLLDRTLRGEGYSNITSTMEPQEVCSSHAEHRYDIILLDLLMPSMDGFAVMEALRAIEPDGGPLPVLVITAEPKHKLLALKAGARDFVSKPLDFAEVLMRVRNMLEVRLLHLETRRLYEQLLAVQEGQRLLAKSLLDTQHAAEQELIGHQRALARVVRGPERHPDLVSYSAAMQQVVSLALRVAQVDSTVLITGQSGTGKERIARLVHENSTRANGPFIAVNCGAITETLLESELFGHARGAFTGATQDRPGLFEAANGGTLLLDEVGEVSTGMQVKLLRVLQEREVRRVGENRKRNVDVRIIAATNRDLQAGVAAGTFRQDLFYRLNVVALRLPTLRERRDDVLALAQVLLADANRRMKRQVTQISSAAIDRLLRYAWPGNVRELENAMERAVALARGTTVEVEDLPEEVRDPVAAPTLVAGLVRPLEDIEKDYILASLRTNGGNQTLTASQLQIGTATLYRRLKSYGLIEDRTSALKGDDA